MIYGNGTRIRKNSTGAHGTIISYDPGMPYPYKIEIDNEKGFDVCTDSEFAVEEGAPIDANQTKFLPNHPGEVYEAEEIIYNKILLVKINSTLMRVENQLGSQVLTLYPFNGILKEASCSI